MIFTNGHVPAISNLFYFAIMPTEWLIKVFIIGIGNLAVMLLYEKFFILGTLQRLLEGQWVKRKATTSVLTADFQDDDVFEYESSKLLKNAKMTTYGTTARI